jgi:hypothetical protein
MYHHMKALILLSCYILILYGIMTTDTSLRTFLITFGVGLIFIYPIVLELFLYILTKIFSQNENRLRTSHHEGHRLKFSINSNKLPICYSADYNITAGGIEKCHPFDSCKYGRSNLR